MSDIELYEIASASERELHAKNASSIADPARRRETKIKQYQAEKEIRSRIEVNNIIYPHAAASLPAPLQAVALRLPSSDSSPTDFDLIAALLPPFSATSAPERDDEQDGEDERRVATLLLLRLAYVQAHAQLSSIAQELELLRSAPPPSAHHAHPSSSETERALWRLDAPARTVGQRSSGPLLDSTGKVSTTILLRVSLVLIRTCCSRYSRSRYCPLARAASAQGCKSRCFKLTTACLPCLSTNTLRLSGSAATFSQEEGKMPRSIILLPGSSSHECNPRPQSAAQPTSSEQLAIDAEQDGTAFGDTRSEEKRRKDEEWARFTDDNPRGAGNTMNRG